MTSKWIRKFYSACITYPCENTGNISMHHILYCSKSYSVLPTAFKSLIAKLSVGFLVLYRSISIPLDPVAEAFCKVLLTVKKRARNGAFQHASDWSTEECLHCRTLHLVWVMAHEEKEDIKNIGSELANFYCLKTKEARSITGLALLNTVNLKRILSLKALF